MSAKVRVLLLWPGTEGAAAGNFGVPQLNIASSAFGRISATATDAREFQFGVKWNF